MLRFFTPADRKRSFLDLYRIKSIEDYIDSISKLNIDVSALKTQKNIHPDYEFIEDYISKLIDKSGRVVFWGVFDMVKEAYFLNKYPHKTILVGDVSKKALSCLEQHYPNVRICESTLQSSIAQPNDLVIINVAEYFLDQKQLSDFVSKGGVICNNVHLYIPAWRSRVYSVIQETKALLLNILALVTGRRQMQFRGWMRTVGDFLIVAKGSGKYVKAIIFNKQRTGNMEYGQLHYLAMIHYERES